MQHENVITLGSFFYETLFTVIIMIFLLSGFGIFVILKSLKGNIIFSKKELLNKYSGYNDLQLFIIGLILLSVPIWYLFYQGHLLQYIKISKLFFKTLNIQTLNIEIVQFIPLMIGLMVITVFTRMFFVKDYAERINDMYILEFNIMDKLLGIVLFITALIGAYAVNTKGINYQSILISILFILMGVYIWLFFKAKILFNNQIIEFYNFKKKTIYWKDVKNMTYENTNRQSMILTTKDDKQYKINTRFSGLTSFISTYKIRNNSKPPSNK
jgi:hypothetical protein